MAADDQRVMYVFPGQGSQYRGMGSDIHRDYRSARRVYEEAGDVLGYDIAHVSFEDPKKQLDLTRFTQPALLTHQIACLTVYEELSEMHKTPFAAGGHSLGEYTALVAAQSLSFENALRLVQARGELMGQYGEGGMLAIAIDLESARPLADKHYCGIGSHNLPDQVVVGGIGSDIDALVKEAAELHPRRRAVPLKTEGAFHTYYMVAAARAFRAVLDASALQTPTIRVLSNYTGDYHDSDTATIKSRLFFQLFNTVNWIGCLQSAIDSGVNTFIEFGGGIGRAETPEGMRPNLESIIKKTLRVSKHDAAYLPAINSQSIASSVRALRAGSREDSA